MGAIKATDAKVPAERLSGAALFWSIFGRSFLIVLTLGAFGVAAHLRLTHQIERGFYGQYGADLWVSDLFPNKTSGYFIDIGAYDGEHYSNTKLLEEKGWHGVCAEPFPHNFQNRSCKLVANPVGPTGGAHEKMADCSEGLSGFLHHMRGEDMLSGIKRYTHAFEQQVSGCPERDMTTVGIADILKLGNAPTVIDYVNLDTEGSELNILQGFPFDRHCVRAWTVEHNCEEPKMQAIKDLLVGRGCRVQQVEVDWWAMCPCEGSEHPSMAESEGGHVSHFDSMRTGDRFWPAQHAWPGRIGHCSNHPRR